MDSTLMHINKGKALFARESKLVCGKSKMDLISNIVDYLRQLFLN